MPCSFVSSMVRHVVGRAGDRVVEDDGHAGADEDEAPAACPVDRGKLVVVDLGALAAVLLLCPGPVDFELRIDDLVVADDDAGAVDGHDPGVVARPVPRPRAGDVTSLSSKYIAWAVPRRERLAIVGARRAPGTSIGCTLPPCDSWASKQQWSIKPVGVAADRSASGRHILELAVVDAEVLAGCR